MSLRLEMLQVARLSPKQLGESSELVLRFLRSQMNEDGGFKDRAGSSDLYYTVFGLEGLLALGSELPAADVVSYLRSFGDGEGLDMVHLSCLVRCWANICRTPPLNSEAVLAHLESHRCADGGYSTVAGDSEGTAYGCFMALAAYQDMGRPVPDPDALVQGIRALKSEDGGYANQKGLAGSLTPSTAAAAAILRHLEDDTCADLSSWLLARCHQDGGFFATPAAPIPDLLSTATALHALSGMHASIEHVKEPCLDFIDTLWTSNGGFYGNWTDDVLDSEYTYYGLLALGHLSL